MTWLCRSGGMKVKSWRIKFAYAMREGEEQGLDISVPSDSPIGVGSDSLSKSAGTNDEFEG